MISVIKEKREASILNQFFFRIIKSNKEEEKNIEKFIH